MMGISGEGHDEWYAAARKRVDELEREVNRLKWFEENFYPGYRISKSDCRFCGGFLHDDDCEYVAHGGKR